MKDYEQVKHIWKPLCLLFAALLVLSWVLFGCLCASGNIRFSTPVSPLNAADGGILIKGGEGNGVQIRSKAISSEEYSLYGVNATAENAFVLTATVEPENASDKRLDWAVSFVAPASSWAKGKTVTDYVTVTPSGDGALTATVACLQAFAEQIKVVATSRENAELSAECTIDYAMRCPSPLFSASGLSVPGHGLDSLLSFSKDTQNLSIRVYPDWEETNKRRITFSNTFITYTVSDTFTATYRLKMTDDLQGRLTVHSISGGTLIDVTDDFTPNRALFEKMFGDDVYNDRTRLDHLITDLAASAVDFTLEISITGKYSEENFSIPVNIDTSAFLSEVTGVSLDETEHVF